MVVIIFSLNTWLTFGQNPLFTLAFILFPKFWFCYWMFLKSMHCFFFLLVNPFFIWSFENIRKTMLHTYTLIFILLHLIIWKQKSTYLCWQVLLVICLTEPWAIQPFAILAEGSSRHFHPPGHNQCYLILCSLLSRPDVLNLLIWKTSNVIWPFQL